MLSTSLSTTVHSLHSIHFLLRLHFFLPFVSILIRSSSVIGCSSPQPLVQPTVTHLKKEEESKYKNVDNIVTLDSHNLLIVTGLFKHLNPGHLQNMVNQYIRIQKFKKNLPHNDGLPSFHPYIKSESHAKVTNIRVIYF